MGQSAFYGTIEESNHAVIIGNDRNGRIYFDLVYMWYIFPNTNWYTFFEEPIKILKNKKMVGTAGLEPTTSRPPGERATRLRHVPTYCFHDKNSTVSNVF